VGAVLAAYPAAEPARLRELVVASGALALGLLLASLSFGWAAGIAWTLVLLAGEYAGALAANDQTVVDPGAPLYAAGLLLLTELAYWSLELRGRGREEHRVVVRRLTALGALAFGSVVLGAFVVVVTAAPLGGGLVWDVIGVGAAAGTLAILARLARRQSHP
jgi:hypothetical protein